MKRRYGLGLIVLLVVVAGAWMMWRYTAPVEVRIVGEVRDLPFEIETIPANVQARPGELVRVIYRIRNTAISPLEADGQIFLEPDSASTQMKIFLSQCSGINTFQSNFPEDYEVLFRVQPAGLTGASQLTLKHVFSRANLR